MTSYSRQNIRYVYETCQYSRFSLSNGKLIRGALVNVQRIRLHKITPFKMRCHAQWLVFGLC